MTMKFSRKSLLWLIIPAAVLTLLALLLMGTALLTHQEMLHEGLTQSQWYEGAVRSYQRSSLWTAITLAAALALWVIVAIRLRRHTKAKKNSSCQQ